MKKKLLVLSLLAFTANFGFSQTTLFDFETPETSTDFQIFGGHLEGQLTTIEANPNTSGINASANVLKYTKGGDAPLWGGCFANPAPANGIDVSNGGQICIDVYMDHIGNLSLKLEITGDDPDNYRQEVSNTLVNEWETLCFDLSLNSLEGNMTPAAGKTYNNMVLFADFGSEGTGSDVVSYYDNITVPEVVPTLACDTIFDFDNTPGTFQYFSSYLDGQLTTIGFNPSQTGINTSDSVLVYIKGNDAQPWAGAFVTPELSESIDANSVQQICLKGYWPAAGNMTLKLELPAFDDPENWIQTIAIDTPNEWTEVCFDLSQPSLEGNMNPATGKVYPKIVLFPDFQTAGTGNDDIYYIDDIVKKSSTEVNSYDVTFQVDMNQYGAGFGGVYVSGSFNNWSGDGNPMSDDDGDGIWSTTVNIEQGEIEYKFTVDNWTDQEMLNRFNVCTKTTVGEDGSVFVNRNMVVTQDEVLPPVCFNSCYACDAAVTINWNLNMTEEMVSEDGVYLAGGQFFGHGDFPMTDEDNDGMYSITIEREIGFTADYTFINGICLPDWGCKENIAGQDCAFGQYNDRHIENVTQDTVISTCFGQCSTDGTCTAASGYTVTLNVDMTNENVTDGVYVFGNTINNWNPTGNPMTDDDGDGIYTTSVVLFPGLHEFKYLNGSTEEVLTQGDDCTITDQSGQFTNRLLVLAEADTVLQAVYFASCELSVGTNDLKVDNQLFEVFPSPAHDYFTARFNDADTNYDMTIYSVAGEAVLQQKISHLTKQTIDISSLQAGVYFIQVNNDVSTGTRKIVVE